ARPCRSLHRPEPVQPGQAPRVRFPSTHGSSAQFPARCKAWSKTAFTPSPALFPVRRATRTHQGGAGRVARVRRDGDTDLVIVGDGDYAETLRAQAADMPRVRFIGRVPNEQLSSWYRHAISLLVPSLCFETFGIILLEAFLQSTPVIARRLGLEFTVSPALDSPCWSRWRFASRHYLREPLALLENLLRGSL
ncbi:MAG: glycosyltransferase family 4 protein, partial [Pleurocapsa sp. SU_196_0]|nr:glycosyltransferase family 4 protein [Pleurocapsa sp. SU_196_0]